MKSYPILRPNGKVEPVPMNIRRAIKERCFNCSGWNWKEVRECKFDGDKQKLCPLWPYRIGKMQKGDSINRRRAIRAYCAWCYHSPKPWNCSAVNCPLHHLLPGKARTTLSNAKILQKNPRQDASGEANITD